jgi:hypothetical protein
VLLEHQELGSTLMASNGFNTQQANHPAKSRLILA